MVRIHRRQRASPEPQSRVVTLTRLILEKLLELGEVTLEAFFPAKYPEARLWRNILGLDATYQFSPRTFSATLSRLRRAGLVARRGSQRRARWSLTSAGRSVLVSRQERDPLADLPPRDGIARLVVFDIPERERKKRDAIRRELIACDFQALQKSVWLGHRPLPEDFIELLDGLNLSKYVHILTIHHSGTIGDQ